MIRVPVSCSLAGRDLRLSLDQGPNKDRIEAAKPRAPHAEPPERASQTSLGPRIF